MYIYGLPLMAKFRERHPNVVFEVDTQDRRVSLEKGEADIAMRSADEVTGDTLIARKIATLTKAGYWCRYLCLRQKDPRGCQNASEHGPFRCHRSRLRQGPD